MSKKPLVRKLVFIAVVALVALICAACLPVPTTTTTSFDYHVGVLIHGKFVGGTNARINPPICFITEDSDIRDCVSVGGIGTSYSNSFNLTQDLSVIGGGITIRCSVIPTDLELTDDQVDLIEKSRKEYEKLLTEYVPRGYTQIFCAAGQ